MPTTLAAPVPFLKWAGRKDYLSFPLPAKFGSYYEPFLGAGGYFWRNADRLLGHQCHLSDANRRLIDAWWAIALSPEKLKTRLKLLADLHAADPGSFYYAERDRFNSDQDCIPTAASLIYLNRTCFNGLYRENASGEFNVPMGDYASPTICNVAVIDNCHQWLRAIAPKIAALPFQEAIATAKRGDFVYLDPPYAKRNKGTFDGYVKVAGGLQMQVAEAFAELDRRGCYVLASNHDTAEIRDLYAGFRLTEIGVRRSINSKGSGRGKVGELAIANYRP